MPLHVRLIGEGGTPKPWISRSKKGWWEPRSGYHHFTREGGQRGGYPPGREPGDRPSHSCLARIGRGAPMQRTKAVRARPRISVCEQR